VETTNQLGSPISGSVLDQNPSSPLQVEFSTSKRGAQSIGKSNSSSSLVEEKHHQALADEWKFVKQDISSICDGYNSQEAKLSPKSLNGQYSPEEELNEPIRACDSKQNSFMRKRSRTTLNELISDEQQDHSQQCSPKQVQNQAQLPHCAPSAKRVKPCNTSPSNFDSANQYHYSTGYAHDQPRYQYEDQQYNCYQPRCHIPEQPVYNHLPPASSVSHSSSSQWYNSREEIQFGHPSEYFTNTYYRAPHVTQQVSAHPYQAMQKLPSFAELFATTLPQ